MLSHDFNVYETLEQLDALLENGHDGPSPLDVGETSILTNKLVHGAVELLHHLAMHNVLRFETPDSYELITPSRISRASTEADTGFVEETVLIELPAHLVPYAGISDAMKTWNLGAVETVADLTILAALSRRYVNAESNSDAEAEIYEEWARQAEHVSARVLPSIQLLDAAGLLHIVNLRKNTSSVPRVVRVADDGVGIEISTSRLPVRARHETSYFVLMSRFRNRCDRGPVEVSHETKRGEFESW